MSEGVQQGRVGTDWALEEVFSASGQCVLGGAGLLMQCVRCWIVKSVCRRQVLGEVKEVAAGAKKLSKGVCVPWGLRNAVRC